MDALKQRLEEETENVGVIDFAEFEAAMNNMDIALRKEQLNEIFTHFLNEQELENMRNAVETKQTRKTHEVALDFLIRFLEQKVDNHEHLKPAQIVKLVFMDVLHDLDDGDDDDTFVRPRSSSRAHRNLFRLKSAKHWDQKAVKRESMEMMQMMLSMQNFHRESAV